MLSFNIRGVPLKDRFGLYYYKTSDGTVHPQFPKLLLERLHLYWACYTIILFKNWRAIYMHRFLQKGDYLLKTRTGITFAVSNKEIALPTIVDVLYY